MSSLEMIREKLGTGCYEFFCHAFKRAVESNISDLEIRQAGSRVAVIEEYPDDK